jgi:hypothetical protein
MDNEREHSKFLIQRFDNYISGANAKGNFLLAFNTFLSGGIVANYGKLIELIDAPNNYLYLNIVLILLFVVGLFTTGFIINAVYPFLKSGNSSKDKYHSKIFFQSVAEFETGTKFAEEYKKQENEEVNEDLVLQAYILSQGLKSKYCSLEWAMRGIFVELILMFVILILIICL